LGSGLRTFYINLLRRPDRRTHIERVCKALGLKPARIDAVDGRELASQRGSKFERVKGKARAKGPQKRFGQAVGSSTYKAHWSQNKKRHTQFMAMATHRLGATKLTKKGHELWGAVGCSLSHQAVLRRIIRDKTLDCALVLEDDATIDMPGCDAQRVFEQGMRSICEECPDWGLIYLGGSLSTFTDPKTGSHKSTISPSDRLSDLIVKGKQMYQTHAYLIRRNICQDILTRLKAGFAADAALVSWTRQNERRCFNFHPRNILLQPATRYKDSDIFVEGEDFKSKSARSSGEDYAFAPRMRNRGKHDA